MIKRNSRLYAVASPKWRLAHRPSTAANAPRPRLTIVETQQGGQPDSLPPLAPVGPSPDF